jgi:Ca2+-binding RTX toxin-like protein
MSSSLPASAEYIWFGTRAVRFETPGTTGSQIELLDDSTDFATRILPTKTVPGADPTLPNAEVDFGGSEWQQFLAFTGTMSEMDALDIDLSDGVDTAAAGQVNTTGDLRVGAGVEAYNIADLGGGGRIVDSTNTLDDADDPLAITGFGRASSGQLDGATIDKADVGNRVIFSNDIGFGFLGGSGFETAANAVRINDGEAINFEIKQGKTLLEASFTVRVLGGGSTDIVLDSDGVTIKKVGGTFAQDDSAGELDLGTLSDGDSVRIDYINELIFINGDLFLGDDSDFFDAFEDDGSVNLTLGSVFDQSVGWSADNLVLATDLAPSGIVLAELPPTCTLTGDPTDSLTATQNTTFLLLGSDVIVGNFLGNTIFGLTGDDVIYGRGGSDSLAGGIGQDTVLGQAGADTVDGDLFFGSQDDVLAGGSGNDVMFGQGGDDALAGGYGADTLTGGSGSDVFVFIDACDTNDVITDFQQGQDVIDLAATVLGTTLYAAGTLDFDPDNGAGFDAAYSVSFFDDGTNTTVIVELDGDVATAELAITLLGVYTLTASDFAL